MKNRWMPPLGTSLVAVAVILLLNVMYKKDDSPYGPMYKSNTFESPVPLAFSGVVEWYANSRGLHVKLGNDVRWFNLSDACNGDNCLKDVIRIGDSIRKDSGAAVVYLVRNHRATSWYLP